MCRREVSWTVGSLRQARGRRWAAPYQVVRRDGHGEDFDAQMLGLIHGILQAPARLLVALQGVPVGHHDQILVLLQVGAPGGGRQSETPATHPPRSPGSCGQPGPMWRVTWGLPGQGQDPWLHGCQLRQTWRGHLLAGVKADSRGHAGHRGQQAGTPGPGLAGTQCLPVGYH